MSVKLIAAALTALAVVAALPAHAEKGGGGMKGGGLSAPHMSAHGTQNANNPAIGQEKGALRADERKSDQGLLHDHPTKNAAKGQKKGLQK